MNGRPYNSVHALSDYCQLFNFLAGSHCWTFDNLTFKVSPIAPVANPLVLSQIWVEAVIFEAAGDGWFNFVFWSQIFVVLVSNWPPVESKTTFDNTNIEIFSERRVLAFLTFVAPKNSAFSEILQTFGHWWIRVFQNSSPNWVDSSF
jgi:hypothetical protein